MTCFVPRGKAAATISLADPSARRLAQRQTGAQPCAPQVIAKFLEVALDQPRGAFDPTLPTRHVQSMAGSDYLPIDRALFLSCSRGSKQEPTSSIGASRIARNVAVCQPDQNIQPSWGPISPWRS